MLKLKMGFPALLAVIASVPSVAFAAVPAAFTTAVTDVTADGVGMAGALVGIAAAVVALMIAIKFVKRIKGAV